MSFPKLFSLLAVSGTGLMNFAPAGFAQAYEVTGSVLDARTDLPIEGARVSLVFVIDPRIRQGPGNIPVVALTDESGRFYIPPEHVEFIQSREVLILVKASGYGLTARRVNRSSLRAGAKAQEFRIYPAVPVSGIVTNADGFPLSGARVYVVYTDDIFYGSNTNPSERSSITTDSDGTFTTDVAVGFNFVIEVSHDDYAPNYSARMFVSEREAQEIAQNTELSRAAEDFRLSPPEIRGMIKPEPEVVVVLRKGLTIRGTVVDSEGREVSEAKVQLIRKSRRIPVSPYYHTIVFSDSIYQQRSTPIDGTFAFRGLFPGDHIVEVSSANGNAVLDLSLEADVLDLEIVVGKRR